MGSKVSSYDMYIATVCRVLCICSSIFSVFLKLLLYIDIDDIDDTYTRNVCLL